MTEPLAAPSGAPAASTSPAWFPPRLAVIVPSYNERDNVAVLYERVSAALSGTPFEFIVVDDNSPDGTAEVVREMARRHPNVRCIHRIGRRGLSSACIEGISATSAPFFAVIDADLQHDETILPAMLAKAEAGDDVVVGTRYAGAGSVGAGFSASREAGSRLATKLSGLLTGRALSDPMSGFFLMRREVFEEVAPGLSRDGFKILLDIIVSATRFRKRADRVLRIGEVPYTFRPRHAGESKMSPLIAIQFLGLVLSKLSGGLLPTSFLLFGMVGGSGVFVHLAVLWTTHELMGFNFTNAQLTATIVAMTTNFVLNNELTYADKKLRGNRFWIGLLTFYAVCSIGALANVSVATWIYEASPDLFLAGIAGAVMSVVFNYSVTRVFTWR
ncbi:dolichol-phosphate mannosyltransferase [Devosia enhydra]|uniref:Dolichol-phosphate mannosyltransferase n=1 Tax=Devosia enhydra TaxID=665118 RepID=A0A1K2I199_9HYPH|nr:glycosyltransferase family 2 protein [Devosia enhydra]SFZ86157.1 dolichol-phosphate mannosyltransferase [Devosia enhydra]